jgi:hypothetical protein
MIAEGWWQKLIMVYYYGKMVSSWNEKIYKNILVQMVILCWDLRWVSSKY